MLALFSLFKVTLNNSWVHLPVLTRRHNNTANIIILWLLQFFCPFCHDILWALGTKVVSIDTGHPMISYSCYFYQLWISVVVSVCFDNGWKQNQYLWFKDKFIAYLEIILTRSVIGWWLYNYSWDIHQSDTGKGQFLVPFPLGVLAGVILVDFWGISLAPDVNRGCVFLS